MIFLLLPLILIIIQGIFAASETALISLEPSKIIHARKENRKWSHRVDRFLKHPERFFSTILISENVIIVISSTMFAKFFADRFGSSSLIYSTVILSVLSLTFGLFIPKSLALSNPTAVMRVLSEFLFYLEFVIAPVGILYTGIARIITRIFKAEASPSPIHRSDIVYAMSEYEVKSSRLASRLFNFSRFQAVDIMIPLENAYLGQIGHELEAAISARKRIYTRIPIYQEKMNNIIGIFNIKDYFYKGKIMLRKPFFVGSLDRCMMIFLTMKQKGEHMAIVRDKDKIPVGIITLEDLIEELVGEIRDEK